MAKILQDETGDTEAEIKIQHIPMKTPDYLEDVFLIVMADMMPFLMMLTFIAPLFRLMSLIVSEKVGGLKYIKKILSHI
jgi:hypothetical protein